MITNGTQAYKMFLILINFTIVCCIGIYGYQTEFNAVPHTSCNKTFCETFDKYPKDSITTLIMNNPGYIQRITDFKTELNFGESKATNKPLCDCAPHTITPLVGLNVYNVTRFIVNVGSEYTQKFKSCSKNLLDIEEFVKTPCFDLNPEDKNYKSMCLPKYQNVILNVIKDEKLYLDEFYVNAMYKCVLVPK